MAKITAYQLACVFFVALGGFTYGFAFSVFVTSIGQPGFYNYFKLDPTSSYTASIIGAVNSLFAAGAAFGAITQGWLGDWFGRRLGMVIAAAFAAFGGALCAGSVNITMLIICRFIQGIGLGQGIVLVSLYTTEVAHKDNRGLLSGMTACSLAFGYVVCSWVGFGAYYAKNETVQWRLPLALACLSPAITLIGAYWIPESPRYLCWVDKKEEAWRILRKLHADPNDPNEEAAHAELKQIILQVEFDRQQKVSYWRMLKKRTWRHRTLLAFFLLFATQCTGILGIGNFQVLLYQSLGVKGSIPLLFYAIYTIIGTVPNWLCVLVMDRIGRRRLLLIGYPLVTVMLIIDMVLQKQYVGTTNKAGTWATIVFLWLYVASYGFFLDPAQFVIAAEIFPTTLRAKGIAVGFAAYFIGAITFTTPAAQAARTIGWKMYLVFIACNVVSTVIIYLYVPETSRLSLEEIGELFGDKVVVHLTSDGHGLVEDTASQTGSGHDEKGAVEHIEKVQSA